MKYFRVKRFLDIIFSIIGLVILSPIIVLISAMIKIDSKGPVFFKQKRVGQYKKHFYILKFRTMRIDTPSNTATHLLESPDFWITRVGKILRKSSLDELPQIINILLGDMSIVGPRPALWNQFDLIEERDKYKANDVPVGLTGWAQINGRDELTIVDKAKLDGEYVDNFGPIMDFKCFVGTFFSVANAKGIYEGAKPGTSREKDKENEC